MTPDSIKIYGNGAGGGNGPASGSGGAGGECAIFGKLPTFIEVSGNDGATPDTEVDAYSRGYKQGRFDSEMDRLNEEKPTPDTEWEKEFDKEFDWIDEYISDKPTYDHYNDIKTFIANQRSSRDTYWKERIEKQRIKQDAITDGAKEWKDGYNQALDTLLDNLK